MMKRNIVSVVAMVMMLYMQLIGTGAKAENIDEPTARALGSYYMSVQTGKESMDSQITLAYRFMNEELDIVAAYVFNIEDQGYVIVSGSDLWYPILGYSTEGLLDTNRMAPAFKWYFEGLCRYISYSQNTGEVLIDNISEEWDALRYRKMGEALPKGPTWLMESKWGQGMVDTATYNKYCPYKVVDSVVQTAYVGCVATAMSQIMKYWNYPKRPADTVIGYECTLDEEPYANVFINMGEVRYDFDKMPIKVTTRTPIEKMNATALLCYHAGVSVQMMYGLKGSGAYSDRVPAALRDVFLYDTSIAWVSRTEAHYEDYTEEEIYSNDEWVALLSEEITAGRPIYYRGHNRGGSGRDAAGHAFVCDGQHNVDSNKFHFNWGWDGMANTWSDVRNNVINAGSYNFYFNQSAAIKIEPRMLFTPVVGISEEPQVELYSAYPNPATTKIMIPFDMVEGEQEVLKVYSVDGKLMDKMQLRGGVHEVVLDVSRYPRGIYFYSVGNVSRKFMVN